MEDAFETLFVTCNDEIEAVGNSLACMLSLNRDSLSFCFLPESSKSYTIWSDMLLHAKSFSRNDCMMRVGCGCTWILWWLRLSCF